MRSPVLYLRQTTLLWIENRKHAIRVLAKEVKDCGDALGHDDETGDLRILSDQLMGYAKQIAELVKQIEQEEEGLR